MSEESAAEEWFVVATAAELSGSGKLVVDVHGTKVLLLWNNGRPTAMNDTCIHRGRSLADGVVFGGRLVCAGHQWAFDLETGFCKAREQYQPVYPVRVDDDEIAVSVTAVRELA